MRQIVAVGIALGACVAEATEAFSRAVPVWPSGQERAWNSFCGLRCRFNGGEEAVLRVTAAYDYRARLNGKFVGFGPIRAAEGLFRIDEWRLDAKAGENVLEIESAGYNCNCYYFINQAAFVQAEVLVGGKVVAATGAKGAFTAYDAGRMQKLTRFSGQRTFIDAWHVGKAEGVPPVLAEQGAKRTEARPLAYPNFAVNQSFRAIRKERLVRDAKARIVKESFIEHNRDPLRNQYELADLETNPYYELQGYRHEAAGEATKKIGTLESVTFEGDRNAAGFIGLRVKASGPCRIVASWDEILDAKGRLDFTRLDCAAVAEWRIEKAGDWNLETFEPYAAKFIDVAVLAGEAEVERVWVRSYVSPLADKTSFKASDPALEKIFRAARESYRANAVDGFTDCPTRERAYWTGDTFFTGRASAWLTGDGRVERTFLANLLLPKGFDWSRYNSKGVDMTGAIPALYPGGIFWGNFIANYMMWTVMQLDEYVTRTGDRAFAEAARESVLGIVGFLAKLRNSDGLLEKVPGWVFVEWSKANELVQDVNYPSNMMYARTLEICARLYGRAEMATEAAHVKREIIRQSWNGEWFCDNAVRQKDGSLKLSGECTETCQYSAFFFGTITPESHPALWRRLLDEFGPERVKRGAYKRIWPSNFIFGTCERLDLLSRAGRSQQILDETRDWFLTMAERTGTLWEHLDTRASCCHGFSAIASEYLFRDILGVREIDRVNRRVRFAPPREVKLAWCEGTLPLAPGAFATFGWRREGGEIRERLDLPAGWSRIEEKAAIPRVWMSYHWGKGLEKAVADIAAHGVDAVEMPSWTKDVTAKALALCRKHGLKAFTSTDEPTENTNAARAGRPYERAVMVGGVYRGLAIDRNLFAFSAGPQEIVIEPPVYSQRQPYGSGKNRHGHYMGAREPIRAEVIVATKAFDGRQHLKVVPCEMSLAEKGTAVENDTVTPAMRGSKEVENRRLVKLRFDLTPFAGALLDKVGIAVYWASDPKGESWKKGRAEMSVFAEATREAARRSVRGRLQNWIDGNGGTFPADVLVAMRFGDECFNVTGWLDCKAASYPLFGYSESGLAAFRKLAPGLEPPRTWGHPEIYGEAAYGAFLYNYHKGCAELTRAVVQEAHRIAPSIKIFRNTTRAGAWSYGNDHDGSGQELLAKELDIIHLDPYPVSERYNTSTIPIDMAYMTSLARRYGKPMLPWLQAHRYAPCGLGHPTPEQIEKMWRQHEKFAPDGIMWLGYGGVSDYTFPNGNSNSWAKAAEIHRAIHERGMPQKEATLPRLAILRPYAMRALVCLEGNGRMRNPADAILERVASVWWLNHGLAYDVFEIPPFETPDEKERREAELAKYEFVISSAPCDRARVVGAGTVGKTYTIRQILDAGKAIADELAAQAKRKQ